MNARPGTAGKGAALHLWRPESLQGVTLFRADGIRQRFARHSHDEYAVGVITTGVLGSNYRGEYLRAVAGDITLVIPGEPHSGEPAVGDDWSYRMFYIDPAVMRSIVDDTHQSVRGPRDLPFFRTGVIADRHLTATITALHTELETGHIVPLEAQSRLVAMLSQWVQRHAERRRAGRTSMHTPRVTQVRDFLDDCWMHKPTLQQLADLVGLGPYQLLRAFLREYGMPPHAYLIQRQVREAKRLLDAGTALTEVALICGFADQSHLNRHFKRVWGVTPGQYRNFVQDPSRPRF